MQEKTVNKDSAMSSSKKSGIYKARWFKITALLMVALIVLMLVVILPAKKNEMSEEITLKDITFKVNGIQDKRNVILGINNPVTTEHNFIALYCVIKNNSSNEHINFADYTVFLYRKNKRYPLTYLGLDFTDDKEWETSDIKIFNTENITLIFEVPTRSTQDNYELEIVYNLFSKERIKLY